MTGTWNVEITKGALPQKVATAVAAMADTMLGAEYEPFAYLGSQVVNGINHAVLAKQILTTGRDTENIVLLIFNEKPNEIEATLVNIERLIEGGSGRFGGIQINPQTLIPDDAQDAWNRAFTGYVGMKVTPVMLLATQIVHGTNYFFVAEATPVVPDAEKRVFIVTINPDTEMLSFSDPLESKQENALGYAFTWATNGLGKPLGEWP